MTSQDAGICPVTAWTVTLGVGWGRWQCPLTFCCLAVGQDPESLDFGLGRGGILHRTHNRHTLKNQTGIKSEREYTDKKEPIDELTF